MIAEPRMFHGGSCKRAGPPESRAPRGGARHGLLRLRPLAFSEEIVEAAFGEARLALVIIDAVLLLSILVIIIRVSRMAWRTVWMYWIAAAGVTLVLDLFFSFSRGGSILAGLLGSALYVLALALLLMPLTIVRNADAKAGVDWARFLALIPLLAGTLAAYIGGVYWEAMNEVVKLGGTPCVGAIDQEYFAQVSQVIPLLLVALGVEARFFDRLRSHSLQRAVTIVTVGILCLAEALAISALPLPNQDCGRVLSDWHEYMAFVGTLEACGAALSMLIWALVTTTSANIGQPSSGATD